MAKPRKSYNDAQIASLLSQVRRVCPLCAEPLFYEKRGRTYKKYELAHIYPLNPKPSEITLLKDQERLSADVNHEDNLIPLCEICHGIFDKPRTVDEYQKLLAIKKELIEESQQELIWKQYAIEKEIEHIINAIYESPDLDIDAEIEYDPKELDLKLNETISRPTLRKIKNNVRDYFSLVKHKFAELDVGKGDLSELISLQVKTYYGKQKLLGLSQQKIYENIVMWLTVRTKPKTTDAAEIIAAFFIQNCEVF